MGAILGSVFALALLSGDSRAQTPPDPVTGLTVSSGNSAGELVIKWDAHPDSPEDYRVKWAPEGEEFRGYEDLEWNSYPTAAQHTVTGLEPGAAYKVGVRARFGGNVRTAWGELVSGRSGALPEPDPTPIQTPVPAPETQPSIDPRSNNEPTFDPSLTVMASVEENVGDGVSVGSPLSATDSDGDTVIYTLSGTGEDLFVITSTGQIQTAGTRKLNYEATNSYSLSVHISDGKDSSGNVETTPVVDATLVVTISIINADDYGVVTFPDVITGGDTITATVTDPDGMPVGEMWQWFRGLTHTGDFVANGTITATYTVVGVDVGKILMAKAYYTTEEFPGITQVGYKKSSRVLPGNEAPTFDDGETTTRSLPENTSAGTDIGAPVAATDPDPDQDPDPPLTSGWPPRTTERRSTLSIRLARSRPSKGSTTTSRASRPTP